MRANIKDLEILAYKGAEMPEALELPEQMLYLSLRSLYKTFRHSQIYGRADRKLAEIERNRLLRSYEDYKLWCGIFKETAEMRNRLSYHVMQINKNGCDMCKKAIAIFTGMDIANTPLIYAPVRIDIVKKQGVLTVSTESKEVEECISVCTTQSGNT